MTAEHLTFTELRLPRPDIIMGVVAHEFDDHDMAHLTLADGTIVSPSELGEVRFIPGEGVIRVEIRSADFEQMYMLKEGVEAHMAHFEPHLDAPIVWQGDVHTGRHPLHFRELAVVGRERLSDDFIRIRCEGDLARYMKDGMHFRLALPPEGRAPVWPTVDEGGKTIWPEGEDALHLPVYTFRRVEADWMEFDVYLHGNGRTCAWAEDAVGKPVGILGPGGGWVPDAREVLFMGDDTAVPAIARMLEMRGGSSGRVILSSKPGNYPELAQWYVEYVDDLLDALKTQTELPYVWFASERAETRAAKAWLKERGHKEMQVTAYWQS